MSVRILIPGALTTVQDLGRWGYQSAGIGTSGVMDEDAYEKANYLVGNEHKEAVLETTLFGGTMEVTEDAVIAATGAHMPLQKNGEEMPMNRPVEAKAGDVITLGMAADGCRTYLAFAGGIDVPVVLGSRSTNLKCKMGGYEGRPLKAGDELPIGEGGKPYEAVKNRTVEDGSYPSQITVRVIEGPQGEYFTEAGKRTFYQETYTISDQSDRMGYRMDGPAVESVGGTDIISDGIALGSIQISSSGQPMVLLADRQTTGGYAKIAVVCSFDIPKLVQGRPGDQVRFERITTEEAQRINRKRGIR